MQVSCGVHPEITTPGDFRATSASTLTKWRMVRLVMGWFSLRAFHHRGSQFTLRILPTCHAGTNLRKKPGQTERNYIKRDDLIVGQRRESVDSELDGSVIHHSRHDFAIGQFSAIFPGAVHGPQTKRIIPCSHQPEVPKLLNWPAARNDICGKCCCRSG